MLKKNFKNSFKKRDWLYKPYLNLRYFPRIIFDHIKVDFYFISPPKAGRTWVRVLLSKLLSDEFNVKFDINTVSSGGSGFGYPKIKFTHDLSDPSKRFTKLRFRRLKYFNKRVIFLARDPRDIIVSYYFEIKNRQKIFDGSIEEFVRNKDFGINRVVSFMNMWARNRESLKSFYLLKYEDLKNDTQKEIKRLIDFLGIETNNKNIKNAVQFSKFENMKSMEKKEKFKTKAMKPKNKKDPNSYKVRKGKVGGFRDYFDQETIDYLNSQFNDLDDYFGYN